MIRNTTEFANELVHFFNEHYFSNEAIVGMWNTYLSDCGKTSRKIYSMEELDEVLADKKPSEILAMIDNSSFRTYDRFFSIWGKSWMIQSFNDPDDYTSPYNQSEIVDWLLSGNKAPMICDTYLREQLYKFLFDLGYAGSALQ